MSIHSYHIEVKARIYVTPTDQDHQLRSWRPGSPWPMAARSFKLGGTER